MSLLILYGLCLVATNVKSHLKNGKKYNYNSYNVRIIQSKSSFNPKMYLIKHNGRELFDISSIREFSYTGGRIWRIQYGNGKITDYDYSSLEINKSVLDNKTAADCHHYLIQLAKSIKSTKIS